MALCMGLAIAMQAPINAALGRSLQTSSLVAAFISFFIGTVCLAIIALLNGSLNVALLQAMPQLAWWKLLGGVLGAFFVSTTILLAPKVGLLNMFLLALVGQLVMSMVLDSIGAFGLHTKPISWQRVVGLLIVLMGLLVFFSKELRG